MSQRGVLFIAWEAAGAEQTALLARAVGSLADLHPELPYHVAHLPGVTPHVEKARLGELTRFETTAFLDVDSVVLGRLDFAFEMAERYGLACCHGENPWRRRYVGATGDAVEYDTGVLFFGAGARPVLELWPLLAPLLDAPVSYIEDRQAKRAPPDDRLSFGHAVEKCAASPFILPPNWSLRPPRMRTFFGPPKIWHGSGALPDDLAQLRRYYELPDAMVLFHELPG
ncbi:MAG: hypothetical protein HY060_19810 [Proteobacteria bacterium]|nr:hypothetical protein [Pseudomonadota bacterium]